jgi:hypothetical protein
MNSVLNQRVGRVEAEKMGGGEEQEARDRWYTDRDLSSSTHLLLTS